MGYLPYQLVITGFLKHQQYHSILASKTVPFLLRILLGHHWKLNVIALLVCWTSVLAPWICLRWLFGKLLLNHHFVEYVLVIFFQPPNFSKSEEQTAPTLSSHQAASRHLKHVTGLWSQNCAAKISHLSIGILTICKNEADVVAEWIEHHAFEGVNIVYIVDDNSTDNLHKTLEPCRRQGIVDIFSWVLTEPSRSPQEVRLNQILRQKPLFVHWLAMIDVHEYVWAPYDLRISDVLSDLPSKAGQVLIPWWTYRSNGHVEQPPQVVPALISSRGHTLHRKNVDKGVDKTRGSRIATVHAHHLKPGFHIFAPDMKTVLGRQLTCLLSCQKCFGIVCLHVSSLPKQWWNIFLPWAMWQNVANMLDNEQGVCWCADAKNT